MNSVSRKLYKKKKRRGGDPGLSTKKALGKLNRSGLGGAGGGPRSRVGPRTEGCCRKGEKAGQADTEGWRKGVSPLDQNVLSRQEGGPPWP